MNAQQKVAKNTSGRGRWSAEQFAARQVCKITNALGFLVSDIWSTTGHDKIAFWERLVSIASEDALSHLNDKTRWNDPCVVTSGAARRTVTNLQITLFNLAESLSEIDGEPFDVVAAALEKSEGRER